MGTNEELEAKIAALTARIAVLEQEKAELRAAVVAAWSRISDLASTVRDRQKVTEKQVQENAAALRQLIGLKRQIQEPDTGYLIKQQRGRWVTRVASLIDSHFNENEIAALCLDLNLDYENLEGDTKDGKARALVMHFDRRRLLDIVIDRCQRLRPAVTWPVAPLDVDLADEVDRELRDML